MLIRDEAHHAPPDETVGLQLAERLRALRRERGWSLDRLASASGVSRAALSRFETGEVSPTAAALGKLCAAYGMTLTRLMAAVEAGFAPVVRGDAQPVWRDPTVGFTRRVVSPPSGALAAEMLVCEIAAGGAIAYAAPPAPGLEHHLLLLEGALSVTIDGATHRLAPGDCLRYRLFGASAFETEIGARYALVVL